ncbi:MAG: hypothetical protein Q8L14_07295 [Myxococcales bacterium]|nr:hypothetical protein [Myxococcales bacterium]
MAGKPLPQLRKPSASSAAAFVESSSAPAPTLEVVRAVSDTDTAVTGQVKKRSSPQKPSRRRMTLYLSKETAKALRLQSFNQERDMSDIAEDILAKALKQTR